AASGLRLGGIEARCGLDKAIEAPLAAPRPGRAISRQRGDDDARPQSSNILRAETARGKGAGAVRLNEDIRLSGQAAHSRDIFGGGEVQNSGALAPAGVDIGGLYGGNARPDDAEHVRAVQRECAAASRPRNNARELENPDTFERSGPRRE